MLCMAGASVLNSCSDDDSTSSGNPDMPESGNALICNGVVREIKSAVYSVETPGNGEKADASEAASVYTIYLSPTAGLVDVDGMLIADDAVEIRKVSTNSLVGTAPKLIRNYIELRGIGIVNVAKLFGMGAVRTENEINLIVNIVPWNTQEVYDRLGLEEQYMELLGVKVPMNTIPITPGRNLAMILEVAAMNNRQKKLGYNAALEFTEQVNQHFDENMGRNT